MVAVSGSKSLSPLWCSDSRNHPSDICSPTSARVVIIWISFRPFWLLLFPTVLDAVCQLVSDIGLNCTSNESTTGDESVCTGAHVRVAVDDVTVLATNVGRFGGLGKPFVSSPLTKKAFLGQFSINSNKNKNRLVGTLDKKMRMALACPVDWRVNMLLQEDARKAWPFLPWLPRFRNYVASREVLAKDTAAEAQLLHYIHYILSCCLLDSSS